MASTTTIETKPHFSSLLKTATPFEKKEPRIEFGKKWKELALPVAAIRIMLHDSAISSIKNVVADDIPRLTMLDQFSASDRMFIFQLLDGEWITKVDAHVGKDYIHAVRFHTNLRVSLWYGPAKGVVQEIAAPEGFVIPSLYGTWGRNLRELGAVFAPVNTAKPSFESQGSLTDTGLVVDLKVAADDYSAPFNVSSHDLGAVVVNVDPDVKWIRVLSRQQVQQLMDLQDGIYPGDHEQWIDLLKGERILKTEVLDDGDVVVGLRFTTTLRTTPWIGWAPDTDYKQSVYQCEPGVSMCGFHGARGREGVSRFGCIVAKTSEKSVEDAPSGVAETSSVQEEESTSSEAEETWDVVEDSSGSDTGDSNASIEA